MNQADGDYVTRTLAMALGIVLMAPDTESKGELVERIKRSIEKVDRSVFQHIVVGTASVEGGIRRCP